MAHSLSGQLNDPVDSAVAVGSVSSPPLLAMDKLDFEMAVCLFVRLPLSLFAIESEMRANKFVGCIHAVPGTCYLI